MPASDRVAERRALLVHAAFDILGTEGWEALTIRSVIERADLNVRYFYENFTELDELAVAAYDSVVEQLGAVVIDTLAGDRAGDPARQVRAVVAATVDFVDEDRRRGRVLYAEGLGCEALNRRRVEAGQAVVSFIEQYAAEQTPGPSPPDLISRVGASILVGGFSQLLIDWLDDRIPVSKVELVDDTTELFLALGDAAARRSAATVKE